MTIKCAIYTRKSTEEGLEQQFNSLDNQRLAGESYVMSQASEGWEIIPKYYDDGGFSGGNIDRPGLQEMFADIEAGHIDCVVVYKIDRLTRSLLDFSKIVELFDKHNVSFVAVTQSFNTSNSIGRLMLNVLLSFAQYERELTGERIRDKIAASKKLGYWMGGYPPLGYDCKERSLIINALEAESITYIYEKFLELKSITLLLKDLKSSGIKTKSSKEFSKKNIATNFGKSNL
jgi:DNA invertase Pin-like site-specific DNA recombinase